MQHNRCVLIQTLALISVLSLEKQKFASVLLDWKSVLKIHQIVLVSCLHIWLFTQKINMTYNTIVDIDECDRFSPCDQVCINSVGSFMCSCESGYELEEDMRICTGRIVYSRKIL